MRLEIYFLFLQCLALCFLGGEGLVGERVMQVRPSDHVYTVSIMQSSEVLSEENHACTGTLVSRRDVLTAEHCVDMVAVVGMELIVGSVDLTVGMRYYPKWWLRYNDWLLQRSRRSEFEINDLAMIRLLEDLPESFIPALIYSASPDIAFGQEVNLLGWGMLYNTAVSRNLLMAKVRVLTNWECEERVMRLHSERLNIHPRFICTVANPYALLSYGDSGGPVLYHNLMIAINLHAVPVREETFHPDQVNIHLVLDYYRDFIYDVMYDFN